MSPISSSEHQVLHTPLNEYPRGTPGYGQYGSDNFWHLDLRGGSFLLHDASNYLLYHEACQLGDLRNGQSSIQSLRNYTNAHLYVLQRFCREPLIEFAGEKISANDFMQKQNILLLATGATGKFTMGGQSDVDIAFVGYNANHYDNDRPEGKAFSEMVESFSDFYRKLGFSCVPIYCTTQDLSEQFLKDSTQITNVTALLDHVIIAGSEASYSDFRRTFLHFLSENSGYLIDQVVATIGERDRKWGATPEEIKFNLKESCGGIRDVDTIDWISAILQTKGIASEPLSGAFTDAVGILMALKFSSHAECTPQLFSLGERFVELLEIDQQIEKRHLSTDRVYTCDRKRQSIVCDHMPEYFPAPKMNPEGVAKVLLQARRTIDESLRRYIKHAVSEIKQVGSENSNVADAQGLLAEIDGLDQSCSSAKIVVSCLEALRHIENLATSRESGISRIWLPQVYEDLKYLVRDKISLIKEQDDISGLANPLLSHLGSSSNLGYTFRLLHEAGIIDAIFPFFRDISGVINPGSYLNTSLVEHLLQSTEALSADPMCKTIIAQLGREQTSALFFATLLHDVGIPLETNGNHSEIAAELARERLLELGFQSTFVDDCTWLIRHHGLLAKVAFGILPHSPEKLSKFNGSSLEQLNSLLALTIADKKSSNRETWTGPKQNWVIGTHRSACNFLTDPASYEEEWKSNGAAICTENCSNFDIFRQAISELDAKSIGEYKVVLRALKETMKDAETFGTLRLAFIAHDQEGLARHLFASIYNEGLKVVDCSLYTDQNSIALNVISMRPASNSLNLSYSDVVERKIERLRKSLAANSIDLNLGASQNETKNIFQINNRVDISPVVESPLLELHIECADQPGLAFKLVSIITDLGFSISAAKFETGNRGVRDILLVKKLDGSPASESEIKSLEHGILTLLPSTMLKD